jgi:hypothetical protein
MHILVSLFTGLLNAWVYTIEVTMYLLHAVWVTIIRGAVAFLEALDDWVPALEILDNPFLRLVVMGGVGFFLGVGLMVFLSFVTGNWGIPCAFTVTIVLGMVVGLLADPEGDWSFGDWPTFGGQGPKTPLNL